MLPLKLQVKDQLPFRLGVAIAFVLCAILMPPLLGIASSILEYRDSLTSFKDDSNIKSRLPEIWKEIRQDSYDGIFWFVHVSDIHLSIFNQSRTLRFSAFLNDTLPIISPEIILASGDLVDAVNKKGVGTQYLAEWKQYKNSLEKFGWFNEELWLDTRGNHDARGTWRHDSEDSYFANYSVSGYSGLGSQYSRDLKKSFGKYKFISLDPCLSPGYNRLLSFFGRIDREKTLHLESEITQALESNYDHVITFGHFPLGLIQYESDTIMNSVPKIMQRFPVLMYLCGHLHDVFGDHLYARRRFYEMEIPDFKHRSAFRIFVIDRNMFSFTTLELKGSGLNSRVDWPVGIVTHPKSAKYLSQIEPWRSLEDLKCIRILIFGPKETLRDISSIKIIIDGEPLEGSAILSRPKSMEISNSSDLYAYCSDDIGQRFGEGLHYMSVNYFTRSRPQNSTVLISDHVFSLDGTIAPLNNLFSHVFLNLEFPGILFTLFVSVWLILFSIVFILLPRALSREEQLSYEPGHRFPPFLLKFMHFRMKRILLSVFRVSSLNLFRAALASLPILPLFGGYLMDRSIGLSFTWGIILFNESFIPKFESSTDTIFISLHHLIQSLCPYFAFLLLSTHRLPASLPLLLKQIPFLIFLLYESHRILKLLQTYGPISLLLSPGFIQLPVILSLSISRDLSSPPDSRSRILTPSKRR